MPPEVAVIVLVPGVTPVATPVLGLIVATPAADDDQLAGIGAVVPSEKMPVAVNGCCEPFGIDGVGGDTLIDCRIALVTVSVVVPVWPSCTAVTLHVPRSTDVATPL